MCHEHPAVSEIDFSQTRQDINSESGEGMGSNCKSRDNNVAVDQHVHFGHNYTFIGKWGKESHWLRKHIGCGRYSQTSNMRPTLGGNNNFGHSNVFGASPIGAALTTSPLST